MRTPLNAFDIFEFVQNIKRTIKEHPQNELIENSRLLGISEDDLKQHLTIMYSSEESIKVCRSICSN